MSATGPTGAGGDSIRFHQLLQRWGPAYLERLGTPVPSRQRQVLQKLLACRTPALGGELFACQPCGTFHYTYHSCNDRHCPQCGQTDADQWLANHITLLLPVPYFLEFKTATGDRDLPLLPDLPAPRLRQAGGRVRWRYRESTTGRWQHLDLEPDELIRRFLQHVLPTGFHRVRRFGWLHPAARVKLNRVRALLKQPPVLSAAQRAAWEPPSPDFQPAEPLPTSQPKPLCPQCRQPMTRCGSWCRGQPPLRPPPRGPP